MVFIPKVFVLVPDAPLSIPGKLVDCTNVPLPCTPKKATIGLDEFGVKVDPVPYLLLSILPFLNTLKSMPLLVFETVSAGTPSKGAAVSVSKNKSGCTSFIVAVS